MQASETAHSGEGDGYTLFFNSQSMKKFSEIKDGLSSLVKISKDQFSEAKLAFSELPQEEQDTAKADLDSLEGKIESETPPVDAPVDTPEKKDDTPPPANEDAAKTFAEGSPLGKIFSENGFKTPEEMALKFAELQKFHTQETLGKQVDALIFSESNKT